jgi:nucleotide-binding universal stress UspA family protein
MYKRILVPVDGSPTSVRGLDEAIKLAKPTGASIRLVHVLDQLVFLGGEPYSVDVFGLLKEAGERIMQEMKAKVVATGIEVSTFVSEILPGRVCDVVLEQAKAFDADLIVVGTHGRRGVGRLLVGSDAEKIVRLATVPVLLVRAPQGAAPAAATAEAAKAAPMGVAA